MMEPSDQMPSAPAPDEGPASTDSSSAGMPPTPTPAGPPVAPPPTPDLSWVPPQRPRRPRRRRVLTSLGSIGIIVAIALGFAAYQYFTSNRGHVLFSLEKPAGGNCEVPKATTRIGTSDRFYLVAILQHHNDGSKPLTVTVTKPGGTAETATVPADNVPFDCYSEQEALGPLGAGDYTITVTTEDGSVEAKGTLSVQ